MWKSQLGGRAKFWCNFASTTVGFIGGLLQGHGLVSCDASQRYHQLGGRGFGKKVVLYGHVEFKARPSPKNPEVLKDTSPSSLPPFFASDCVCVSICVCARFSAHMSVSPSGVRCVCWEKRRQLGVSVCLSDFYRNRRRQSDRQPARQAGRQTARQAGRQTNRQRDTRASTCDLRRLWMETPHQTTSAENITGQAKPASPLWRSYHGHFTQHDAPQ